MMVGNIEHSTNSRLSSDSNSLSNELRSEIEGDPTKICWNYPPVPQRVETPGGIACNSVTQHYIRNKLVMINRRRTDTFIKV